jgi:hypothetical protein
MEWSGYLPVLPGEVTVQLLRKDQPWETDVNETRRKELSG